MDSCDGHGRSPSSDREKNKGNASNDRAQGFVLSFRCV